LIAAFSAALLHAIVLYYFFSLSPFFFAFDGYTRYTDDYLMMLPYAIFSDALTLYFTRCFSMSFLFFYAISAAYCRHCWRTGASPLLIFSLARRFADDCCLLRLCHALELIFVITPHDFFLMLFCYA